jgi:hypothetical protein
MTKEITKFKFKTRRKAESTMEGMAGLKKLRQENKGRIGLTIDNVITGGPKRGHGRGKASDAGPSKKRKVA